MSAREVTSPNDVAVPPLVRIVLIDDEVDLRNALIELLETEPSFEVVGSASFAEEGIRLIADSKPDIALVDVRTESGEGDRATREALEQSPGTRVVGFSAAADRDTVVGMFRAGAIGFVQKGSPPQRLLDTIHAALDGRSMISSDISGEIVAELAGRLEAQDADTQTSATHKARIEEALSDREAMHAVFQPIFEIGSNRLMGFEALARFAAEPQRPPNEWFDEAASVGLGSLLEAESIRRAVEHFPELPESVYMSVNVSPETLPTPVLQAVLEDVPLDRVVVELTEHAVVHDYATLGTALDNLRGQGARFAVDDAGAGYSSLRHIVRLSPDFIKLDIELTSGIEDDPTRRALAAALMSFTSATEQAIVAEGVETTGELDALQALGVPFAQGFLLGRPAPLPEQGPFDDPGLSDDEVADEPPAPAPVPTRVRAAQELAALADPSRMHANVDQGRR
jgi:EAL domain-containing protein (putative c-di-GMP-specific phosphodiesterase class I)/CheY-like chemotaxis protein